MSDLFDSKTPDDNQDGLFNGDDTPQLDPNKQYFSELVGEGKKFKTNEDLARGKYEADQFIERLKREQHELRQELLQRKRLEDIADLMSPNNQAKPNSEEAPVSRMDGQDNAALTSEQLEALIEQRLSKREQERSHETNFKTVKEKLSEAFGPNYAAKLKEQASELGVGEAFLNNLAKEQPKALFKLLGIGEGQKPNTQQANDLFAPPRSSVNQSSFTPNTTGERTKAYYDNIKKNDAREYWSPRVQNAMHQDAIRLGAKFFA